MRSTALICVLVALCGCGQRMMDQPRYEPLELSTFFDDQKSSRDLVPGTVPRGGLRIDRHLYEGTVDGRPATSLPEQVPLNEALLLRGQERFNIYCAHCHGHAGTGDGMVVRRGYPPPPSFYEPQLLDAPLGHFYDVISNGIRKMPAHASQIAPEDRWAIAAYVRVLQVSQFLELEDAPPDIQAIFEEQP